MLLLLIPVLFCGCGMSNDEYIKECDKCKKAGYSCERLMNGFDYSIRGVNCVEKPKEKK